jgi:hypothetical protein
LPHYSFSGLNKEQYRERVLELLTDLPILNTRE